MTKKIYGFRTNLNAKAADVFFRNEFIEQNITKRSTTVRRIGVAIIVLALLLISSILLIFNGDPIRKQYIFQPLVLIYAAILILLFLYTFMDQSTGSLLKAGLTFAKSLIKMWRVNFGKDRIFKGTGIETIDNNGLIIFENKDIGYMYLVDGSTSLTAFPKEQAAHEKNSRDYQNKRRTSTTEIHITSSQLQDATDQLNNIANQYNHQKDPRIRALLNQQYIFVDTSINGIKSTIVQYLIVRDPTANGLDSSIRRLNEFKAKGIYSGLLLLGKKEAYSVFSDIYMLK